MKLTYRLCSGPSGIYDIRIAMCLRSNDITVVTVGGFLARLLLQLSIVPISGCLVAEHPVSSILDRITCASPIRRSTLTLTQVL